MIYNEMIYHGMIEQRTVHQAMRCLGMSKWNELIEIHQGVSKYNELKEWLNMKWFTRIWVGIEWYSAEWFSLESLPSLNSKETPSKVNHQDNSFP